MRNGVGRTTKKSAYVSDANSYHMPIEHIHSFLVHPSKHAEEQPDIQGAKIAHKGGLFDLLMEVYRRAPKECDIEIVFNPDEAGRQVNESHDALIEYSRHPSIPSGREIALRLQRVTTHRSGLGLLFLITGRNDDGMNSLVVSRFPADQGILAEESIDKLSVQFVERVFMRNARAYKSALYQTRSFDAGYSIGRAIDRQISGPRELSDYWIRNFLQSELKTTGPAGSRRIATALRQAIRKSRSVDLKQELVAAARLMRGQHNKTLSARNLVARLALSDDAVQLIESAFPREELMDERFRFDAEEFSKHATYRTVELDNGAMLVAEEERFAEVFEREVVVAEEVVKYTTQGRIIDEKIKKTK